MGVEGQRGGGEVSRRRRAKGLVSSFSPQCAASPAFAFLSRCIVLAALFPTGSRRACASGVCFELGCSWLALPLIASERKTTERTDGAPERKRPKATKEKQTPHRH